MAIEKDMQVVHALAKGCGMKIGLSEFKELNNNIRLKRLVLVNWDFDKQNVLWNVNVD